MYKLCFCATKIILLFAAVSTSFLLVTSLQEIMASAKEEMRTAKRMYDLQVKTANDMRQKFRKLEAEYIELQFVRCGIVLVGFGLSQCARCQEIPRNI